MKQSELQQNDSMEEILRSIQQIIEEEEQEVKQRITEGEDILELTEIYEQGEVPDNQPIEEEPITDVMEKVASMIEDEETQKEPSLENNSNNNDEHKPNNNLNNLEQNLYNNVDNDSSSNDDADDVQNQELENEKLNQNNKEENIMSQESLSKEESGLLSGEQIANSVSMLNELSEKVAKETMSNDSLSKAFRSGVTIEDITKEAIKPLLKEWLDENLPAIVKKMIKKEIRRITSQLDDSDEEL